MGNTCCGDSSSTDKHDLQNSPSAHLPSSDKQIVKQIFGESEISIR